jgi:hypothetical protein
MAEIISLGTPVWRLRASLRASNSTADLKSFNEQFWRELYSMTPDEVRMMQTEALAHFCEIVWREHPD